jgi:hypothetical protein
MSLWYTDKNTERRSIPTLNAPDASIMRMSHGTFGVTLRDEGSDVTARLSIKDGHVQVHKNDGTLIANFGIRVDGEGAVDVAKPGDTL